MMSRHIQRLQPHWDWRAAGNFICGGAGAGLAFFAALCAPEALQAGLAAAGMALVGLGLFFVWLEIGRPLRAMNVLVHLRTSWMSREAVAAIALFLLGAGLVFGTHWRSLPAAVAALVFLYCQARLLGAARGVPAWRHPLTVPMLIVTGLTEGMSLFWLLGAWWEPPLKLALLLVVMIPARWMLWLHWRRRLQREAAPAAVRALAANAPWMHWVGTAVPLLLIAAAMNHDGPAALTTALLATAGLCSVAAGWMLKFTLVTRAGHLQGFSLPHMPVRGVPRIAPR
jgi:phenylacetyl-CoA:acceptor oxidoreductase 26-kDa subunit